MHRQIAIITLGLAAVAGLNAGQIQLGQIVAGLNDGLTTTYVGSPTGTVLKNYDAYVFLGNNNGTSPTPFTGYSNTVGTASTPGSTMVDSSNNVTFDMISQSGNNGNAWALVGPTPSITIPAGVFGVTSVWTMMNDMWGVNNALNTVVTFTFDNLANGSDAGSLNTVSVNLQNGLQIRDAIDCTAPSGTCTTNNFANSLSSLSTLSTTVTGSGPASVQVATHNLFSTSYNTGGTGAYANTSGNLVLDDQGFLFGNAYANQYLVSVTITDPNAAFGVSRTALSAITVNATPEPATIALFGSALGLLGLARRRRNSSKA